MLESSAVDEHFQRIAEFYDGKSVFVTGATGFVGTVLLETLLRCCVGIKSIYILLRTKRNVQANVRKEKIFEKKIFEKLKETAPEMLNKVHVIPGDASLPNLGISEDDVQLLAKEVSVVFHCAAIINFKKPLKFILLQNVLGLNTIIDLCRKMKKFEVMAYTSTAYCNCNHIPFTSKEEVYRLPFTADKFLDALKNNDDERLLELYAHCKPDWPNTYTFSKCLAENLIMDTASDLPIVIVRPSVIICTSKHPIPGYIEKNSGLVAISLGVAKGYLKFFHADPNCKVNFVPVDIVANAHVVGAWSVGTKRCMPPMVVNCTASEKFIVKFCDYFETITELVQKFPLPNAFNEHTYVTLVLNRYLYYTVAAYHHYLPAIVLDGIKKLSGKKTKIYSMYRYLDKVTDSLFFFASHTFEFERNNLEYLDKLIHPEERKDLGMDLSEVNFADLSLKVPEACSFYDWKIDEKSPLERQKIIYWRNLKIHFIQGMFMILFCLLVFSVFS